MVLEVMFFVRILCCYKDRVVRVCCSRKELLKVFELRNDIIGVRYEF